MTMNEQQPSVLVVDDDPDTCQNLADILQDCGYEVDTALNGEAALELVRRNPYDVALLDLKMPGMDGLTLYREIRKLRAGTVAMIVTGYASSGTAQEALQAGAWQVLSKPVDFPQLLPLLDEAVQQPMVLVVDDDSDLCDNLWDMLRERNYRVCVAHNAPEAAERLQSREYRVVLIDLKLPQGDGRTILDLVRRTNLQARTILITGYRSEMQRLIEEALREGADAVCYKPFDVPQLLQTIQQLSHRSD